MKGALLLAALLAVGTTAVADPLVLGVPPADAGVTLTDAGSPGCTGYNRDAQLSLSYPVDGGPADPLGMCPGQRVPAAGVFDTVPRASLQLGAFTREQTERQLVEQPFIDGGAAQAAVIRPVVKACLFVGLGVAAGMAAAYGYCKASKGCQ